MTAGLAKIHNLYLHRLKADFEQLATQASPLSRQQTPSAALPDVSSVCSEASRPPEAYRLEAPLLPRAGHTWPAEY